MIMCSFTDDPSESILQSVCGGEAGEGGEAGDAGDAGDGGRRVGYYVKVMRLFEQIPSPSYVIKVTKIATKLVNKDHPNAVSYMYITNVDGMKDLWCSSTVWLISTQIWMERSMVL